MTTLVNAPKKHVDVITKYFYPVAGGIENNIMQTYVALQNTLGWDVTIHTLRDTYTEKYTLSRRDHEWPPRKRYEWRIRIFS